ncbi:MAG: tRNA lysidine(34) synthetase TilS [Alphaproteobacteria bacterium]
MAYVDFQIPQGNFAIGVSGGGDSMALVHRVVAAGGRPVVLHYNHQWSAWGDKAEAFVRAYCKAHKLKLVVGKGRGRAATNAEETARKERYGFFAKQVAKLGLEGVLVAHTQTDDVEGFFMRLARGSGVKGLSGMAADGVVEGVRVVRPLLGATREELRAYLKQHKVKYLNDPSNGKGDTFRGRVRKVLPALAEAGILPQHVAASMASLRAADAALEATVQSLWALHGRVEAGKKGVCAHFPRPVLLGLPEEVAVRILAVVLRESGQPAPLPRRAQLVGKLQEVRAANAGKVSLGQCAVWWNATGVGSCVGNLVRSLKK